MKRVALISALAVLTGCASYRAEPLATLDPPFVHQIPEVAGLTIGCKTLSKDECITYLGRDLLSKGYQPIQLTFQNQTDQTYFFSEKNIDMRTVPGSVVAEKAHTSTVGRVFGYTAGAVLVAPLIIGAVVDGIRSYSANSRLDTDYLEKSRYDFFLTPRSFTKTVVFIPLDAFSQVFSLKLVNQETGAETVLKLTASI